MKLEWEEFKDAEHLKFGETVEVKLLGPTSETHAASAEATIKGGASAELTLTGMSVEMAFPTVLKLDVNLGSSLKKEDGAWGGNLLWVEKKTAAAEAKEQEMESAMTKTEAALAKAGRAETVARNTATRLSAAIARIQQ